MPDILKAELQTQITPIMQLWSTQNQSLLRGKKKNYKTLIRTVATYMYGCSLYIEATYKCR